MLEDKKVLVVDDENKIVEVVKSYLQREAVKYFKHLTENKLWRPLIKLIQI